jgi:hypothetical protein
VSRYIVLEVPDGHPAARIVAEADSLVDLLNRLEAIGRRGDLLPISTPVVTRMDAPNPHQGPHLTRLANRRTREEFRRGLDWAAAGAGLQAWTDPNPDDADDDDDPDNTPLMIDGL